jgi:acetyl-CoA synthetase
VEAAAVGIPHDVKGEAVWCFCVLTPKVDATPALAERLAERVETEIGKPFRPERVVFVEGLPRTRSAKIVRRAIRAIVRGEDPGDLGSIENPDALEAIAAAVRGTP